MELSENFRKKSVKEKQDEIKNILNIKDNDYFFSYDDENFLSSMIENYVGYLSLPVGIVRNLKINNKYYSIPISTEEPSVIAALNMAAKLLLNANLNYLSPEVLGISQVYIRTNEDISDKIFKISKQIESWVEPFLVNMKKRGGGFKYIKTSYINELQVQKLNIYVNTIDAMGANLLNSIAEKVASQFELEFNLESVLKILSNDLNEFPVKASFSLSLKDLSENNGEAVSLAKKIELISQIGFFEEERAITNNKGIMNGITGLALITLNDTRALEASAHKYASITGRYLPLSKYFLKNDILFGEISIPLQVATYGGAANTHKASKLSFDMMGVKNRKEFAGILACVGLASNFAALRALALLGIQEGHMNLHINKVLYILEKEYNINTELKNEIKLKIKDSKRYSLDFAVEILEKLRTKN